jgi:hypothetical protein
VWRVERLLEQLGTVDALQQLVNAIDLLRGGEVEPEREATKAAGRGPKSRS